MLLPKKPLEIIIYIGNLGTRVFSTNGEASKDEAEKKDGKDQKETKVPKGKGSWRKYF